MRISQFFLVLIQQHQIRSVVTFLIFSPDRHLWVHRDSRDLEELQTENPLLKFFVSSAQKLFSLLRRADLYTPKHQETLVKYNSVGVVQLKRKPHLKQRIV